jgi:hypothetical protein
MTALRWFCAARNTATSWSFTGSVTPLWPGASEVYEPARELTPEQLSVLHGASAEELHFLVIFARNYVGGKKVLCWGARAIVALGMLAGAVVGIISLIHSVRV